MGDDTKVIIRRDGGVMAPIWFTGWLFTIGYLHLHMPKALYAIVIWPFYLGSFFGHGG